MEKVYVVFSVKREIVSVTIEGCRTIVTHFASVETHNNETITEGKRLAQ